MVCQSPDSCLVVVTSVWFPVKARLKILANKEKLHGQAQLKVHDGVGTWADKLHAQVRDLFWCHSNINYEIAHAHQVHNYWRNVLLKKWPCRIMMVVYGGVQYRYEEAQRSSGAHAQVLVLIEIGRANTDLN